jgi:hypothetical protein
MKKNAIAGLLLILVTITAQDAHAGIFEAIGQAVIDASTFCETCRQRDRRTAEHERDVAAGERAKQEALLRQHIEDLKKNIENKAQEIQAWKEINAKSPEIESVLKGFVDSAAIVRQHRMESTSYLQRVKKLFNRENHDLETVTGLLETMISRTSAQAMSQITDQISPRSAKDLKSSWNQTIDSMKQLAALRNQQIFEYLDAAEKASSDETLAMFIAQATILRNYIAEMDSKVDQQIKNHEAEKEKLENELGQLIEPAQKQKDALEKQVKELKKILENNLAEVKAWTWLDLEAVPVLRAFINSANAVRDQRMEKASYLQKIKTYFTRESENRDLESVTSLLDKVISETTRAQVAGQNKPDFANELQSSWQKAFASVGQVASLRNQKISEYLFAAEEIASDESLSMFITQATTLCNYIDGIKEQIKTDEAEKEKLMEQMAVSRNRKDDRYLFTSHEIGSDETISTIVGLDRTLLNYIEGMKGR